MAGERLPLSDRGAPLVYSALPPSSAAHLKLLDLALQHLQETYAQRKQKNDVLMCEMSGTEFKKAALETLKTQRSLPPDPALIP